MISKIFDFYFFQLDINNLNKTFNLNNLFFMSYIKYEN